MDVMVIGLWVSGCLCVYPTICLSIYRGLPQTPVVFVCLGKSGGSLWVSAVSRVSLRRSKTSAIFQMYLLDSFNDSGPFFASTTLSAQSLECSIRMVCALATSHNGTAPPCLNAAR
ncbi:hypothetical protein C8R44DRAFT_930029 [Mycena epipterygia]|nr:hypothetical protein C8R44DRAFT_930029 [Mycena epipterygia]